ncbi:hypothetical protein GJ700_12755 [Duganella sp. FT92W]|uniref:DUF4376 domain-containing protein n=1 Tax=Pseudoduganella rivuli TaxID=2666085 RepID=A0A7X2IN80_9BURK|nr:hypothetical protein [Pseudoduganella rivuli]MRV72578.1 hypothetical protein [Pseudoduganella rivuli]
MDYVTYDENRALTGRYTGQEPQDGEQYFELTEPLELSWTAYRMNEARDGLELVPPAEPPAVDLPALRQALAAGIDEHIAAIYRRFTRFESEYTAREAAARAFAAAEYEGDPGTWVSAFATAAGMTNEAAADLIIAQADTLRTALELLGALRMRKYEVLGAEDVEGAQGTHGDIVAQADTIAAGL